YFGAICARRCLRSVAQRDQVIRHAKLRSALSSSFQQGLGAGDSPRFARHARARHFWYVRRSLVVMTGRVFPLLCATLALGCSSTETASPAQSVPPAGRCSFTFSGNTSESATREECAALTLLRPSDSDAGDATDSGSDAGDATDGGSDAALGAD